MAKEKIVYVCSECGNQEPKWNGRCLNCGAWNSFVEESIKTKMKFASLQKKAETVSLESVSNEDGFRIDSGIKEINRVLGDGIMAGSAILLGGQPGIGKSTILMQIAGLARVKSVFYVSGEESASQIKNRADRLKTDMSNISLLCENNLDIISDEIKRLKPSIVMIDSIQTLICSEAGSVPGTVNQIKFSSYQLISICKEMGITIFFTAHVTKDGNIAGPKIMEHLVDTVLYFEEAANSLRILRAFKNRFGTIDELGLFLMEPTGLIEIENPAQLFTVRRDSSVPAGISCAMIFEGSRVLPIEVQALVTPAQSSVSRTFSDKIDSKRVSRIAAVLEKHIGLKFSDSDLYINVAGGIKIDETGIDLPIAFALYSSRTNIAIKESLSFAGEISLAGEIRPIKQIRKRAKTSLQSGYKKLICPNTTLKNETLETNCIGVSTIAEAIKVVFKD